MLIAWDTETALIEQGLAAPPITCLSWATEDVLGTGTSAGLYHWREGIEAWQRWVAEGHTFVGHHVAFDHAVLCAERPELLPVVFKLYEEGRVTDTMLRQQLLDNAEGRLGGFFTDSGKYVNLKYSLEALAKRLLKRELDKDTWRLRYGELRDVPLSQWEPGALQYPVEDARATFDIYQAQERRNEERGGGMWLVDQYRQAKSAWWLNLASIWGVKTDPSKVDKLAEESEKHFNGLADILKDEPWGFIRSNGVRNMQRVRDYMVRAMGGLQYCRKTKPSKKFPEGQVCLDEDACLSSGDVVLEAYAELTKLKAVMSKDVKMLRQGMYLPIHTRYNTILETGRTSSSKPNLQNLRRFPGIRECVVPRPGFVFAIADYSAMELRCLAQVCLSILGRSDLAEALNAGRDPHLEIAAFILGIPYDEAVRRKKDDDVNEKRQFGKVVNFGCSGGLGAETLTFYAKANYGVILTIDEAKYLRDEVWKRRWTEMPAYLALISRGLDRETGLAPSITQLYSGRVRGGCRYTQAANTLFQGLGADMTKAAGFEVSKACYVDKNSPLYGSRIVIYPHDELILEVPEQHGHEAVMELVRIMKDAAKPWLPDVPATVDDPMLARYWSKKAKPVWKDGRLVPWAA